MGDMIIDYRVHRFSVGMYHRMARHAIVLEEERVELFDGQIIEMPPIGADHVYLHRQIYDLLSEKLRGRYEVYGQISIPLGEFNEPQPDIAVVEPGALRGGTAYPRPDEIVLVVEIAKTSLRFDLGAKASLYAQSGVAQYVVVDLVGNIVVAHREPSANGYGVREEIRRGTRFAFAAAPEFEFDAGDFLLRSVS